jgi:carboxymethylenebutenolidase
MAYSRSFAVLQRAMGPEFDLSALWDRHLECEFVDRDVESNMQTMVAQPYVNSIPTMTGGVGYDELYNFYKYHFLDVNPGDTRTIPFRVRSERIGRSIGPTEVGADLRAVCKPQESGTVQQDLGADTHSKPGQRLRRGHASDSREVGQR